MSITQTRQEYEKVVDGKTLQFGYDNSWIPSAYVNIMDRGMYRGCVAIEQVPDEHGESKWMLRIWQEGADGEQRLTELPVIWQ
jgi:hypothetical protein